IVSQRLNDADRQTIFSALELKDLFALRLRVLLLPLKDFFNRRMPDNRHPLIVIQKPLDHVRHRINIDLPRCVALQWWQIQIAFACHNEKTLPVGFFNSNDAVTSPTRSPRRLRMGKNEYLATASSDSSRNTPNCRNDSTATGGRARLSSPSSILNASPRPFGHSLQGLIPAV